MGRFGIFVRDVTGRAARLADLSPDLIQAWVDAMAAAGLAPSTVRIRQAAVSSFCRWLQRQRLLTANPVDALERPPNRRTHPAQVPGTALMDRLVQAARARGRSRDIALLLTLRYSGMRRESVATLRVRHLDWSWGLRGVPVKGGDTQDVPLPSAVRQFLRQYVEGDLAAAIGTVTARHPSFLVAMGPAPCRCGAAAHDWQEPLAAD
jgi:site-specific recombinase XerC